MDSFRMMCMPSCHTNAMLAMGEGAEECNSEMVIRRVSNSYGSEERKRMEKD